MLTAAPALLAPVAAAAPGRRQLMVSDPPYGVDCDPEWHQAATGAYACSVLLHLFFVTLLPFSMIVAGRYNLAPAIFVYGANMVLLTLTAIGITLVVERDTRRRLVQAAVLNTAC